MGFFDDVCEWGRTFKDKVAIEEFHGESRTYEELARDIAGYASYYKKLEQDRIAVLGATVYGWFCNAYGALAAGKDMIAVDALLPASDIVTLLKYTDAQMVYTDEKDRKLGKALEEAGIAYETFPPVDCQAEDEFIPCETGNIIFFTSGTSGKAKGVVTPFDVLCRNSRRLAGLMGEGIEGKGYVVTPTGHLYANTMVTTLWYQGRTVCLGSPRRMEEEIAYFKPVMLNIVTSMAEYLLLNEKQGDSVKVITVGGSKCEKSLEELALSRGIYLQNLYGASEFGGAAAASRIGAGIEHLSPLEDVEITLENDDEIVISMPDRMSCYYKKPEATAKVLKDGKIYLGDCGIIYEDGTFSLLGRKQDMISMKNGSKLYYNEVDEELSQLELVKEACVLYADERIVAVVVTDAGHQEEVIGNIKAYNKKQPYFRKIEDIWVRQEALPRTGMGKLKRRNVLAEYLSLKEK